MSSEKSHISYPNDLIFIIIGIIMQDYSGNCLLFIFYN